jgi:hypothetical protein
MITNTNTSLTTLFNQVTTTTTAVGYSLYSYSLTNLPIDIQQRSAQGNSLPGGQSVFLIFTSQKLTLYYQAFKKSIIILNLVVTTTNITDAFFTPNSASQIIILQQSPTTYQTISLYSNATKLNQSNTIIPSTSKLIRTIKNSLHVFFLL